MKRYFVYEGELTIKVRNATVTVDAESQGQADNKLDDGRFDLVGNLTDLVAGADFEFETFTEGEMQEDGDGR